MPKKILYVEDDEKIRARFSKLMTDYGFEVFQAGTSADAKKTFLKEGDISLVVLDIDLNEKDQDGLDLGYWIKRKSEATCPEFVVVSSCNTHSNYQKSFRLGAAAYFPKEEIVDNESDFVATLFAMELRYQLNIAIRGTNHSSLALNVREPEDQYDYFCGKVVYNAVKVTFGFGLGVIWETPISRKGVFPNGCDMPDTDVTLLLGDAKNAKPNFIRLYDPNDDHITSYLYSNNDDMTVFSGAVAVYVEQKWYEFRLLAKSCAEYWRGYITGQGHGMDHPFKGKGL